MGKSRKEAAREGAREVGMAITASTLTTIAVFLPLYFGGGLAGELVRGLAVVVAFALASSLLVALTMVPMLASVLFNREDAARNNSMSEFFERLRVRYRRLLHWVLNRRKRVLGAAFVLFLGAGAALPLAGATFLPGADAPLVLGLVKFPVGTPLAETDRALRRIEAFVATFPDVLTVGSVIGVNEDDLGAGLSEMSPSGVHEAQIFARLTSDRKLSQEELLAQLRAGAPKADNMVLEFMDMGQAMMGGGGAKPVQIQLRGKELDELGRLAQRAIEAISSVEGLTEIDMSLQSAKPERHLVVDRDRAASYGVSIAEIARAVETAAQGMPAGFYREGGDEFLIRVRYRPEDRNSFDAMDRVMIPTRAGFNVPLRQLASFQTGFGPVSIAREGQSRQVVVRANIQGRDLRTVMREVQDALGPLQAALPPGYRLEYGGMYEEMIDAFMKLLAGLALAILLVYMVMAGQFEAFVHPIVIMVTMPLALIGVAAVLVGTGTPFSVVTFVGVIMLAGIVVNNGIVLIDHINQLRASGMDRRSAVIQGGSDRLRAVLITSGTTITGLLPMALFPGRGAELTADMALTVAGGLASATVLTLVIVPVVYEILDSAGDWVQQRVLRIVHSEEIPEAPPVPHAALTAPVRGAALRVASLRIRRLTFGSCRRFIAEPLLEG
jgi:HAE1 family hydrophobic/amphiphilic exporter-1